MQEENFSTRLAHYLLEKRWNSRSKWNGSLWSLGEIV